MSFVIRNPSPELRFARTLVPRTRTTRIIIHHYHHEHATPQDVHRWHLDNGWSGFGYNAAIDMDGTIWDGRGLDNVGAHAGNHNSDSIGIAVQGRYDDLTTHMPDEQFNSLVWLIKHLRGIYGNIPILRHGDVTATACPGKHFPWAELLRLEYRGEVVEVIDQPIRNIKLDIMGNVTEIDGYIESGITWVRLAGVASALGLGTHWDEGRRMPVITDVDGRFNIQPTTNDTAGRTVIVDMLGDIRALSGYIERGITWVRLAEFVTAIGLAATWDSQRRMPVIFNVAIHGHINEYIQDDLHLLRLITHHEARGEDEAGQILIVNVVKNRVASPHFPDTVRDVIFAPGAFTPTQRPDFNTAVPNARTIDAVNKALGGADYSQGATFFLALRGITPDVWHERAVADGRLVHLFDHGGHRFYREV